MIAPNVMLTQLASSRYDNLLLDSALVVGIVAMLAFAAFSMWLVARRPRPARPRYKRTVAL